MTIVASKVPMSAAAGTIASGLEHLRERTRPTPSSADDGVSVSHWWRFVAETAAIILLLVALDFLFLRGDGFGGINPHPLWIPVLFMSAQYGLAGGLFATVAATATLYGVALPPQSATQDFYAYSSVVVREPIGWLACALFLGGLRSLHMAETAKLRDQMRNVRAAADALTHALDEALVEISALEGRIAGEMKTLRGVVRALSQLDMRDAETLIESFGNVMRYSLGADAFTIYRKSPESFAPAIRIGAGEVPAAICAPRLSPGLVEALLFERRTVSRLDPDAARLLPADASLAVPIIAHPSGVIHGALLIERLQEHQEIAQAARLAERLARAFGTLLHEVS